MTLMINLNYEEIGRNSAKTTSSLFNIKIAASDIQMVETHPTPRE